MIERHWTIFTPHTAGNAWLYLPQQQETNMKLNDSMTHTTDHAKSNAAKEIQIFVIYVCLTRFARVVTLLPSDWTKTKYSPGLAVININRAVRTGVTSITATHVLVDAISALSMFTRVSRTFIDVNLTQLSTKPCITTTRVASLFWDTSRTILALISQAIVNPSFTACT